MIIMKTEASQVRVSLRVSAVRGASMTSNAEFSNVLATFQRDQLENPHDEKYGAERVQSGVVEEDEIDEREGEIHKGACPAIHGISLRSPAACYSGDPDITSNALL
ncbi:hypothetical protein ACQKOH_20925 [Sphingomonas sp. NPDC092331]|jgi:hypothetical protein|uniref:hypothetical protein n=1 Tax=unclassified Sphingomonas TaxID=196159 RepID=UPI0037FA0336